VKGRRHAGRLHVVQDGRDRFGRRDRCDDLHAVPAATAFENVIQEHAPYQRRPWNSARASAPAGLVPRWRASSRRGGAPGRRLGDRGQDGCALDPTLGCCPLADGRSRRCPRFRGSRAPDASPLPDRVPLSRADGEAMPGTVKELWMPRFQFKVPAVNTLKSTARCVHDWAMSRPGRAPWATRRGPAVVTTS
jgi:hypothetical protein